MNWRTSVSAIPSGNAGNARTIRAMSKLAAEGSVDPVVVQAAQDAVRPFPERNPDSDFAAILANVRRRMRYTHDPLGAEVVKEPRYVIDRTNVSQLPEPMDCDDASTLCAAMLGAIGYPSKFVTVAVDHARPSEWSHVYVAALHPDGRWIALDPIVRDFEVGEEVPAGQLMAPRAYHEGVDPMMRGFGCAQPRTMGVGSAPVGLGYSARGMGEDSLEQMRADAEKYGGIPRSSFPSSGGSSAGFFDGTKLTDLLSTAANVFTSQSIATTEQAKADMAKAQARIAKFQAPKVSAPVGFFTNADGTLRTGNVLIAAGVGTVVGLALIKMLRRR